MDEKLKTLVAASSQTIEKALERFKNPCTLWSGGHDSMVMLHLLKFQLGYDFPVVCWREPWHPWKQKFVNRVIQEWNLTAYDYAPSKVELCEGNGRIDVLNFYQTGPLSNPNHLMLARGTESPRVGDEWICGVDTFLSRPTGTFDFQWDLMFHGHKNVDEDPTSGKIPLETDLVLRPGAASALFPLRHWTDEDVFQYTLDVEMPFDGTRYDLKDGQLTAYDKSDLHHNPDYYHTCFECVKRDNPAFVHCPKMNMTINNVSNAVIWREPSADYCNLRTANGQ